MDDEYHDEPDDEFSEAMMLRTPAVTNHVNVLSSSLDGNATKLPNHHGHLSLPQRQAPSSVEYHMNREMLTLHGDGDWAVFDAVSSSGARRESIHNPPRRPMTANNMNQARPVIQQHGDLSFNDQPSFCSSSSSDRSTIDDYIKIVNSNSIESNSWCECDPPARLSRFPSDEYLSIRKSNGDAYSTHISRSTSKRRRKDRILPAKSASVPPPPPPIPSGDIAYGAGVERGPYAKQDSHCANVRSWTVEDPSLNCNLPIYSSNASTYRGEYSGKRRNATTTAWESGSDDWTSTICGPCPQMPVPTATAAAIGCCAVAGGILLGPMGIVLGAAAIGLAAGYTQIPVTQRYYLRYLARKSVTRGVKYAHKASEHCGSALEQAVEALQDSSCGEKLINKCNKVSGNGSQSDEFEDTSENTSAKDTETREINNQQNVEKSKKVDVWDESSALVDRMKALAVRQADSDGIDGSHHNDPTITNSFRKGVIHRRRTRINGPIEKIHTLPPPLQAGAWLDVIASAYTSVDEKNEALEELLLLAKDKNQARIFLEDGILDSLLFILTEFFQKYSNLLHHRERQKQSLFLHESKAALSLAEDVSVLYPLARLSSRCCVALGKAHCAAVHTDGELLLMSSYHRGTVPESRQLAQLLYEVPHHASTVTADYGEDGGWKESFTLVALTLQQAEDLSKMTMLLSDGKMEPTCTASQDLR